MERLSLHEIHSKSGAQFAEVNGHEVAVSYGNVLAEHSALRGTAGVMDLNFRSRLVLTGADRVRFLHGQVTNDVKSLREGEGCYAALTTAKGRMESDLFIYCLAGELLLEFEPGMAAAVSQRLENYLVADDVQVVDASPHYGLLTVQGPKAGEVLRRAAMGDLPNKTLALISLKDSKSGEFYLVNQPRLGTEGYDLFVPSAALADTAARLTVAAQSIGGRLCGWEAFEMARIEAGVPRFGADMDETNFPQECGIENRAVSYNKGCYIGQEVLNRIHTMGHVNRALCGVRLADDLKTLPVKDEPLFHSGKEAGRVTSAVASQALNANVALAIVRRESNQVGTELTLQTADGQSIARVVPLPFQNC